MCIRDRLMSLTIISNNVAFFRLARRLTLQQIGNLIGIKFISDDTQGNFRPLDRTTDREQLRLVFSELVLISIVHKIVSASSSLHVIASRLVADRYTQIQHF